MAEFIVGLVLGLIGFLVALLFKATLGTAATIGIVIFLAVIGIIIFFDGNFDWDLFN